MIMNRKPYPISFEREMSQALVCRYGEEMRQYVFKPDIDVSGLSCLLQIAKTDGTFTENGVEVHTDPDTGECTLVITIPQQATVVKGLNRYSICVYGPIEGEDHLLYSAEGPLWVDDDLITDEMIASVAEVNGLVFPRDFLTVENLVDIVNYVVAEILKDNTISTETTWSSQKISDEISGHSITMDLADLDDVEITNPSTGQVLSFDDDDKWKNKNLPDVSVTKEASGNPIEITDAAAAPLVKCVTAITGYQEGSGTPSPDNIRPIVAYAEGEIEVRGKNLFDIDDLWDNGTTYTSGTEQSRRIAVKVKQGASLICSTNVPNNTNPNVASITITNNPFDYTPSSSESGVFINRPRIITPSENGYVYIGIRVGSASYLSWSKVTFAPYYVQLELGLSATTYEPYTSTTHTTTYPNAIYRGSEDCVKGEVVTEWGVIASYAGETLPGEWISDRDEYEPGTTPTTGAQVAYELATPTTAPVAVSNAPIKSLSGYNHIESSTGNMEVEYITQTYEPILNVIPEEYPGHIYSTDEKEVGKWIDGRSVYEKTFEVSTTSPLGVNSYSLSHGISNLDRVLNYHGSTYWPGSGGYMIPSLSPDGSTGFISMYLYNDTYLGLSLSDFMKNTGGAYYIVLTIQYIKEV